MKTVGVIVVVLLLLGTGTFAWAQHRALEDVREEAASLEDEKEAWKRQAEEGEAVSDSLQQAFDSLEAVRAEEKRRAALRDQALRSELDSLSQAILDMVPAELVGTEVSLHVARALEEMETACNNRVQNERDLRDGCEVSLVRLQEKSQSDEDVKMSLRRSLAASEQQAAIWEAAANPPLFAGLWKQKGPLSVALTVGVLGGLAISR
jgi:hypothetical protein